MRASELERWQSRQGEIVNAHARVGGELRELVIPSAIRDSEANQKLLHRWVLDDVNGTVEDSVGTADGANNGVTSVSGDYAGGSAGDGDGVDDFIETTPWGSFGSDMPNGFSIAFSVDSLSAASVFLGVRNSGSDETGLWASSTATGDPEPPEDVPSLVYRSQGSSSERGAVWGATNLTDGGPYRVVFNVPGTDVSNWEVWVNQTDDTDGNATGSDGEPTNPADFDTEVAQFAWKDGEDGSINDHTDGVLDDICVFGDSLTQSEIGSYQNPWE